MTTAFTPCPCGALVLTRVWVHGTSKEDPPHWRELGKQVSGVFGEDHVCREEEPDDRA
jgi:hypothetical protein